MSKTIGKNISKNLSSKQSQKLFDYAKPSTTDTLKNASEKAIQKTVEATSDLIVIEIANKFTKVLPKSFIT